MFKLHTKGLTEEVTLKNLPTIRQAFVIASLIIIIGFTLAHTVNENFRILVLLVAAGLMFAGLTGICPMIIILQKMPWSKK